MAENSGVWNMTPNIQSVDPNEKLFLFGYSCKLFRDDEKARYIEKGKHLIPWMGDDSIKIDRYDVRGYLHDLKHYEAKPGGYPEDVDSEEEKLCEEERYRSLRSEFTDEQLYHEEELKRLRAAVASDGAYHEIGFSYENAIENSIPSVSKVEEPEDEPYEAPPGLVNPKGLETPSTMKIHAIIEKTAMFVSEQGGQMEIIIKMKQHANPQFGFMQMDNLLHPYYRHLIKAIKSGSYKPIPARRVSRSEDEDDDGHYLHPSLTSGKKENVPQFTVPSINFKRSHDDSYSVLVRNLQQQQAEEKTAKEQQETLSEDQQLVDYSFNQSDVSTFNESYLFSMVVPPPDIQPIIHKMADYVAKNGEDFEIVVKDKNDKRFEFLQPTSVYFNYYMQLREEARLKYAPAAVTENLEASYNDYFSNYESNGIESYSENVYQDQTEDPPVQSLETTSENTLDEFDALYTQDSQDIVLSLPTEIQNEDAANSMDSVDSLGIPKYSKFRSSKAPKGPISFSLKPKEGEPVPAEKTKIPLLLDDSDDDVEGENNETVKNERKEKITEEKKSSSSSKRNSAEKETKPKLTSEMEAKLAEEQKKNRLLSAARERLLQHKKEKRLLLERMKREEELKKEKVLQIEQYRKDKELQLERKKKAALFLKMLKKRDPASAESLANKLIKDKKEKSKDLWSSEGILTENGVVFPDPNTTLNIRKKGRSRSSSSSESQESGEEIMITEFCSYPDQVAESVPEKIPDPVKQEHHKKKKRKRSRSRSKERREHRSKSSRSKDRRRSRSPRNHKHEKSKKEKELPAAYALKRSRSKSRSPRRHRQVLPSSYYNRRR